jgi:CheY-like chemotaxis protein
MEPLLKPLAVVIEPSVSLADTLLESLEQRGYEVLAAGTHSGAAQHVIERDRVDVLIAAVPAPGEDRSGAYLADALLKNPGMAVVVMLSDPTEVAEDAPESAVRLLKPFDRSQLDEALDRAAVFAGSH